MLTCWKLSDRIQVVARYVNNFVIFYWWSLRNIVILNELWILLIILKTLHLKNVLLIHISQEYMLVFLSHKEWDGYRLYRQIQSYVERQIRCNFIYYVLCMYVIELWHIATENELCWFNWDMFRAYHLTDHY